MVINGPNITDLKKNQKHKNQALIWPKVTTDWSNSPANHCSVKLWRVSMSSSCHVVAQFLITPSPSDFLFCRHLILLSLCPLHLNPHNIASTHPHPSLSWFYILYVPFIPALPLPNLDLSAADWVFQAQLPQECPLPHGPRRWHRYHACPSRKEPTPPMRPFLLPAHPRTRKSTAANRHRAVRSCSNQRTPMLCSLVGRTATDPDIWTPCQIKTKICP